MTPDLSILVCSTDTRFFSFAPRVLSQIFSQRNELPGPAQVEVLCLTDARGMSIGAKRNALVDISRGRYVQFIDDDDRIADDMLAQVLDAVVDGVPDVVAFPVLVTLDGGDPKVCRYSKDYGHDHNTMYEYRRIPNHICAVRRVLVHATGFADRCHGEDADYARRLLPHLRVERQISETKPLYFYEYSRETSESRR